MVQAIGNIAVHHYILGQHYVVNGNSITIYEDNSSMEILHAYWYNILYLIGIGTGVIAGSFIIIY